MYFFCSLFCPIVYENTKGIKISSINLNVLPVKKLMLCFKICASGDSAKQFVCNADLHSAWQVTNGQQALYATVATGREYFPQGGIMINTRAAHTSAEHRAMLGQIPT
jgi:hypothetical protein